ncbi:MAG: glycosyltransferase [Clostridiales bacterium]|nr:glycosyltransferase [Clostridiales bacterium]
MEFISVIIPVYNTGDYLSRCVDSVLAQRHVLHEIILVDDGSTDCSADKCDEYARANPDVIRVFHQTNQGAAAARNHGIEQASGDYLAFIDSDDYVEPDMYERLLEALREFDADMAACAMWVEQPNGQRYCRISEDVRLCWDTQEALVELNRYRYLHTSFCTSLFRRDAIGNLRFPEGKRCEDYHLLYQVFARCRKVAYTSSPLYHYIQRPNSNSRTVNISLEPINASLGQLSFFQKHFPRIVYAAESDCAFAHMGIYTAYVRNAVDCPKPLLRQLQKTSRKYLGSVLKNGHIAGIKKLQALSFCYAPWLYRFVIRRTEHR